MRNFLRKASEYYSTYSIELAFFKHRVLQVTRKNSSNSNSFSTTYVVGSTLRFMTYPFLSKFYIFFSITWFFFIKSPLGFPYITCSLIS
jgi:hypothetical protein